MLMHEGGSGKKGIRDLHIMKLFMVAMETVAPRKWNYADLASLASLRMISILRHHIHTTNITKRARHVVEQSASQHI